MSGSSPAAHPTWFGPDAAPLFGVVHIPADGQARGGIVICPPLGKEHVDTYRGLKLLAERLAASGFAVLRFDYLGTGDSAGRQGADTAVAGYLSSIDEAVQYLRRSGAPTISLIGLRVGALLAATAADTLSGLDKLVLWDPVTDGRRYLREQRALYKMTVGDDTADTTLESILGLAFSTAGSHDLSSVKLPVTIDGDIRTLVLTRPERTDDKRLRMLVDTAGATIESAPDQAAFVEPPSFLVEIPYQTIDLVSEWFNAHSPCSGVPLHPVLRAEAIVERQPDGAAIVESIEHFGPHRLFGIRTTISAPAPNGPTVLFHSTAYEHRIGSGRIWTEIAREFAGLGIAALRYDRRGTGDSGPPSTGLSRIYSEDSQADITAAVSATGVSPDRLMMTGVCSGAWNSAIAAIGSGARSVVLVNIIGFAMRQTETDPDTITGVATGPTLKRHVKSFVRRHLPYPGWLLLGKLGLAQVPEVLLAQLRRRNVRTDIVLSPADLTWFEEQHGRRSLARVSDATWRPELISAPTGDHPLLQRDLQVFTRRHLLRTVKRDFGPLLADARPDQPRSTC